MMTPQSRNDLFDGGGKCLTEHATKERAQGKHVPRPEWRGVAPTGVGTNVVVYTGAVSITGTCVACSTISKAHDYRTFQRNFCYTNCYVVAGFATPCSSFGGVLHD